MHGGRELRGAAGDTPGRRNDGRRAGSAASLCPRRSGSREPCTGPDGVRSSAELSAESSERSGRRRDHGLPARRHDAGRGARAARVPGAVGAGGGQHALQPRARLLRGIPSARRWGMRPPAAPGSSGDGHGAGAAAAGL